MKLGIILTFHDYEKYIDKDIFIKYANQFENVKLCLVNNESKDNTYNILKDIKERCDYVSVVNIKKRKADISAVKAGARFLFNQYHFDHLGYVNANQLNKSNNELEIILKSINKNQHELVDYNLKVLDNKATKQTLFQKLFSIVDYLVKLKLYESSLMY